LKLQNFIQPGTFIAMKGKIEVPPRRSELEFVIHAIELLQNLKETKANSVHVKVSTKALDQSMIMDLNKLFLEHEGRCNLHFTVYDPLDGMEVKMPSKSMKVDPNNTLFKELKRLNLEFEIK